MTEKEVAERGVARMAFDAALAVAQQSYDAAMMFADMAVSNALRAEEMKAKAEKFANLAIQHARKASQ